MRILIVRLFTSCVLALSLLSLSAAQFGRSYAQDVARTFPETGKTVSGTFLVYWNAHGGLSQQGYPISEPLLEKSDTDGKTYQVQYFERAVFELHPELQAPNNVLLSLLGVFLYGQKYPAGAPGQVANSSAGAVSFPQTGKHLGGRFLQYWQQNGGLAQQGYPISEEFSETSALNDQTYTVQYFERAVFELHPENKAPYDVLLSQLGTFRYAQKYATQPPVLAPTPTPGATVGTANCPTSTSPITAGDWLGTLDWGFTMSGPVTGKGSASGPVYLKVGCDGSFTGQVQINNYAANITGGGITVLTCSMSKPPIADIVGRVESGAGGKHLNITGGKFRQGITTCSNPLALPRPTDLTGNPVAPSIVAIEHESPTQIGGSNWAPDPSYITLIEQFRQVYKDVQVAYTGAWQLTLQGVNTP